MAAIRPRNGGWEIYWREGDAKWSWYSARSRVKIFVTNPSDHTQKVVLSSGYRTAANEAQGASLWIDGLGVHDRLDIGPVSKRLDEVFEVPPGTHLVTMRTDAKPPPNVPDWRTRAFTLENPQLRTE